MRFLHGTLYVVARSAGQVQSYQVLARQRDGTWNTTAAIGALPEAGGGPFIEVITTGPALAASTATNLPLGNALP